MYVFCFFYDVYAITDGSGSIFFLPPTTLWMSFHLPLHLAAPHPSFCADVSRGQMFIAIIKQPLL